MSGGEFDLIRRYFTRPAPAGFLGVGDDCALMPVPSGNLAISTDLLIEGRHFFSDVDPRSLGHKSLAVNLSDLAAMGAQPSAFVLGLALPAVDDPWLAEFSRGMLALADAHQCALIGGDTTRSNGGLVVTITILGTVSPAQALRRSGARAGDDIWLSGQLGAADIALRILSGSLGEVAPAEREKRLAEARRALEWPEPRVVLGLALRGVATAAIDVSDGLMQDLGHVLQASGCGAELWVDELPVSPVLAGLPTALVHAAALGGGDVYELCFTAPADRREQVLRAAIQAGVPVTRVGSATAGVGLRVVDGEGRPLADLPSGGFDHFVG